MFNNLKIGVRLGIGFAVILAFLIAIASVSYIRLDTLNDEIMLLVNDKFPKTVQVSNSIDAFSNAARQLRNAYIYTGAEQQKSLDDIAKQRLIVSENLNKLEKSITSEKGKEFLKSVTTARAAFGVSLDKAIELIKLDRKAEVVVLMQGDLRKSQTQYIDSLNALNQYQTAEVDRVGKLADALADSTQRLIAMLGAGAVLLTLLLSWIITRGITGPVNTVVDAAKKMAVGDFNFKLHNDARNEVGQLSKSVEAIQVSIQSMAADADLLIRAAMVGELSTRSDTSKHQGSYRQIVEGFNMTLDYLVGYIDNMPLPAMIIDKNFEVLYMNKAGLAVGNTDLAQLHGKKCSHYFKTDDCNTEKCACQRAMSDQRISKSQTVARPTDKLNLDIDYIGLPIKDRTGQVIGAFEVVMDQTMIKQAQRKSEKIAAYQHVEVSKLQDALSRVAAGDLSIKAEVAAADEDTDASHNTFAIIADATNQVVNSVTALVADAAMLSKAAVEGKLETRADASKHQGDFRKVVKGVNDTLDAVVYPIQDVQRVMAALERGDMTQTITKAYQGDFNSLKEAINNTIAKLVDTITQINTAADALTNAASQVSATAQSLSQSSSEQAASVEETTSSMEQMTASISQNTENAKVTDGMASKSAREAAEGGEAVSRTVEDMKSIAGKIGIIDDIAYQTNLLALNAAIEAARAGDHGKGFAVVAAEVRKLAERSQIAAQEIGNLASSSVKQAERAGALLTEMVPSIRKTSDLVQEIASASQEQSSGVVQINGAMGQLNQTTQQNASASEELAATAEELGAQANELQQTMTFFKLNEDGHGLRSARRAAGPARKAAGGSSFRATAGVTSESDFERF